MPRRNGGPSWLLPRNSRNISPTRKSHHIRLSDLGREFGPDVGLASEEEIQRLFPDCARGAVPALGQCYGLNVMVDASIEEPAEVYLEGGDHASLIHMSRTQFAKLMAPTRHGRFSMHG